MNIPEEAVIAAAYALREAFDMGLDGFEEQARAALEAAAPRLQATAWDEGQRAWEDELLGRAAGTNPYGSKP